MQGQDRQVVAHVVSETRDPERRQPAEQVGPRVLAHPQRGGPLGIGAQQPCGLPRHHRGQARALGRIAQDERVDERRDVLVERVRDRLRQVWFAGDATHVVHGSPDGLVFANPS